MRILLGGSVLELKVLVAFPVRSDTLAQSTAVPTGWAPSENLLTITPRVYLGSSP